MLKKLVKYDLKWLLKVIVIFLALGIFFATTGRLLDLISDSLVFSIVSAICKGAALSMLISGLFNLVIRSWVRIILNLYKDEAYLTHTLPIKRETHYLSKVLSRFLTPSLRIRVIKWSLTFSSLVVFITLRISSNFEETFSSFFFFAIIQFKTYLIYIVINFLFIVFCICYNECIMNLIRRITNNTIINF